MIKNNKQVFMYFSDMNMHPSQIDSEEYKKIQQFKEKYKDNGYYGTYKTLDEFKELFFAHLTKYFLSLSTVKENENSKKPDLKVELLDSKTNEPIGETYKFEYPIGLITRKELSQDDIFDEIEQYVTIDDIKKYNEALPQEDEVESYNEQQRLYENSQNNCYDFKLLITNVGNTKANDIYIDLYFPKEVLVYYDDDIEDIKEPKEKPQMPENPIRKAMKELDKKKMKAIMGNLYGLTAADSILKQTDFMNNWGFNNITPVMAYPNLNMGKLINPKRYNYYIEDHNELSLHINDLLHTRMYDSDKFSLIFTSCGEFEIGYSVMCEEWEEPVKGNFQINVEYK